MHGIIFVMHDTEFDDFFYLEFLRFFNVKELDNGLISVQPLLDEPPAFTTKDYLNQFIAALKIKYLTKGTVDAEVMAFYERVLLPNHFD
jgi:hypothetical protein